MLSDHHFAWSCWICLFVATSEPTANGQNPDTSLPPVEIRTGEAQLFVDDYLIASQTQLKRTLHQPKKDFDGQHPVVAIEDEFGETKSTLEANGTILFDPRLNKWVMFCLAFASNWPGESADRVRLYRFTSKDGLEWTKGDDGLPQRIAIDLRDPSSKTSATNIDLFSCTYDERNEEHPYQGWLFFANWGKGREGTYHVQSADGIHWKRGQLVLVAGARTFDQDGRTMNGTGDVTTFYDDRQQNRYLACLRFASATDVENTNRLRSRGFLFTDRLDQAIDLNRVTRLNLIPEGAMRNGDMPTDEYYSSTAWRYGSLWLGGLRIWHSRDDYPYSAAGCAFLKLVSSRDGLHWKKIPFANESGAPEVFIANGIEGGKQGRNDGGYMTEFSNPPIRRGEELIYYYGCSSWGKNHPRPYRVSGGGVFRARMRVDGFVSVDGGSLVTRKLKISGNTMHVNAVGPVTIEVVQSSEPNSAPLASAHIQGDSTGHRVTFDGNRKLSDLLQNGMAQFRFAIGSGGALYSFTIDATEVPEKAASASQLDGDQPPAQRLTLKNESFDRDPNWVGVNNRSAREQSPIAVRQDFGFSPNTSFAGGAAPGEIGGLVTAAGEVAFYGKRIALADINQRLSASGVISMDPGATHLLLGFFNSKTLKEWRTPNTIAIRLNGRGEKFFAYVEYCTSKWRAGGDTTPFPSVTDPETGRWNLIGYPCRKSLKWTLTYDPAANEGKGAVTATIGDDLAVCNLDPDHKTDGASFDHFGILNVMKSVDSGSAVWLDDVAVLDSAAEDFSRDPQWDGRRNRASWQTTLVRPWFDFGFSDTNFAGGKNRGELGGQIFRGDCREPHRMACYGDPIGPLTLEQPIQASGRVTLRRAVSDSTALFGFYNSRDSMRVNESQRNGMPEAVLGIHIEGPSSLGFRFYPVLRVRGGDSLYGEVREFPTIYPDGASHEWSLTYDPRGNGLIVVTLDGKSGTWDLPEGTKSSLTTFDRFGIVTSWIDGNSQDVYWDDLSYTAAQK